MYGQFCRRDDPYRDPYRDPYDEGFRHPPPPSRDPFMNPYRYINHPIYKCKYNLAIISGPRPNTFRSTCNLQSELISAEEHASESHDLNRKKLRLYNQSMSVRQWRWWQHCRHLKLNRSFETNQSKYSFLK